MLYIYDKNQINFKKINLFKLAMIIIGILGFFSAIVQISHERGFEKGYTTNFDQLPIETKYHIVNMERDTFSEAKLIQMLKDLNVRFPHIVMAQAHIESGHFQSNIFRSNHNLFGMKQARARCTTAKGTELNHAYYNSWRESVYDYAFFQSRYLNDLRTEEAYLDYLDRNYAEAPEYDKAILRVIKDQDLKAKFK